MILPTGRKACGGMGEEQGAKRAFQRVPSPLLSLGQGDVSGLRNRISERATVEIQASTSSVSTHLAFPLLPGQQSGPTGCLGDCWAGRGPGQERALGSHHLVTTATLLSQVSCYCKILL